MQTFINQTEWKRRKNNKKKQKPQRMWGMRNIF